MKKQIYPLAIALILLATTISAFNLGSTTDLNDYYPRFEIISPKSTVYHNSTVAILAVVTKLTDESYPLITSILYTLNGSDIFTYKSANFIFNGLVNLPNNKTGYQYMGKATLEDLKEGNYTLKVVYGHGNTTIGGWFTGTSVNFRVIYGDYEPAALLSPTNQTYHSSEVPLVFSTNEDYIYAYYCLNGEKPIFIKPNSMLTGLAEGSNNLLVFLKFRDIHSDFRVNFTVDLSQPDVSSNLIYIISVLALVITALLMFSILYRRKLASKQSFA